MSKNVLHKFYNNLHYIFEQLIMDCQHQIPLSASTFLIHYCSQSNKGGMSFIGEENYLQSDLPYFFFYMPFRGLNGEPLIN